LKIVEKLSIFIKGLLKYTFKVYPLKAEKDNFTINTNYQNFDLCHKKETNAGNFRRDRFVVSFDFLYISETASQDWYFACCNGAGMGYINVPGNGK
jgi:hypothetical protein